MVVEWGGCAALNLCQQVGLGVDGGGGLFAAGYKKRREYVKYLIDRRGPLRLETVDEERTITKLAHVSSHISHVQIKVERLWSKQQEAE